MKDWTHGVLCGLGVMYLWTGLLMSVFFAQAAGLNHRESLSAVLFWPLWLLAGITDTIELISWLAPWVYS